MAQFKAFKPGVEVSGAAVLAVVQGMESFKSTGLKILAQHGIVAPKPEDWFSQQAWLDAFKAIAETLGPATLRNIGKNIPETALWPPDIKSVVDALASIDIAYHMNHRGGEIGNYYFEKTGVRKGKFICNNPYPCEFDFGIIKATTNKFAPKDMIPLVKHDDTKPCRQKGADSCTYLVSW